ncbi:netrin receptor UNC5C [Elysia marginata]|uniref:Netrin receptor UNC5 n=1 Tax=Elysia marginata TaxID=1093978 RepID=A0AAV4GFF7_9GAST|nr:netrin receptor UNC5C [Elysia marginata]
MVRDLSVSDSNIVILIVYGNGGWSAWSEWSECSATCGKGKQKRHRTCSDPAPYNNGLPCDGDQQQAVTCSNFCNQRLKPNAGVTSRPVSGELDNSGHTPTLAAVPVAPASEVPNTADPVYVSRDQATATADKDPSVSLYIGLCVAVALVLIVIIILVVFLCRKHNRRRSTFRDLGPDATQSLTEDEKKQKNGDMLSSPPDLTQTMVVTVQHNNHHGQHPQQHQHHNNQTYNHSQSSGEGPNNNLSMDKMPSYIGVGATSSCSGGSGGAGPGGDNSPSYSVPELPNIYPQSDLEAAQYSVPDTGLYNISGGSRDYSPVAGQPYPQHHIHYPAHPGQPIYALNGSGGSAGASSIGSGISGGPTPYSTSVAQPYYPEMGGPPGLPNRHSSNSSNGTTPKTVMVEPTINHNLNSAADKLPMKDVKMAQAQCEGAARPMSQCDSLQDSRQSVISVQLPGNVDTEAVTWSTFNHMGGRLVLPESGVMLTVPEGAIRKGHVEELYMAVCRDDKDRPRLSENQTILSPVILVGPPSVQLLKPVILSFQHCANMRQGGWVLSIFKSESPIDEPPYWRRVVVLGHETINSPIYTQLDPNQCHVMTEFLNRYTLIGESVTGGRALKIYRLAAFAPAMPPSMDYSIRVYVVEDTMDALDGVIQVEKKLGGRLLDKPKQIPFQDGGNNLCLTIEELSQGWRSKLAANYQEIPFRHIWSGNQNNLHCSFSLELLDRSVSKIACKIQVYQKAILSNRQTLLINCNLKDNGPSNLVSSNGNNTLVKQRASTVNSAASPTSSGFHSMVALDPSAQVFRLPSYIKAQLCMLLDPPNVRGNDWRMLAQALTVDRYINFFATKSSPTEHILDLWEARHREDSAVTDLMNILRVMGRMDAAAVLEKDNGSWL